MCGLVLEYLLAIATASLAGQGRSLVAFVEQEDIHGERGVVLFIGIKAVLVPGSSIGSAARAVRRLADSVQIHILQLSLSGLAPIAVVPPEVVIIVDAENSAIAVVWIGAPRRKLAFKAGTKPSYLDSQ